MLCISMFFFSFSQPNHLFLPPFGPPKSFREVQAEALLVSSSSKVDEKIILFWLAVAETDSRLQPVLSRVSTDPSIRKDSSSLVSLKS